MAPLYSNENFPLPSVIKLRCLGHDVLTIQGSGNANRQMSDEEVLAFAVGQERTLLTLNRKHFVRLHNGSFDHAGIIVCTYDSDFIALADRVNAMLIATPNLRGQLLRVNRGS
jgi:Domain of unknown function (DUF5615)